MSQLDKIIQEIQETRHQAIDEATCELLMVHKIINNRSEYKDAKHVAQRLMSSGHTIDVKYFDKGKGAQDVRVVLSRTIDSTSMHFPSPFSDDEDVEVKSDSSGPTLIEKGWKPIAHTDECLELDDYEIFVSIGYEKDGVYGQEGVSITRDNLDTLIDTYSMEGMPESKFNKKFKERPAV